MALSVAARKLGFLAAVGCKRVGIAVTPVVQPIPSSSNANTGLSTVATDAPT